jgi:ADP-heptose:LPS heptosyltransferase
MFERNRTPLDRLDPRRVCIIKPSALGDIVHALPVLSALRQQFPVAEISWVVNRSYELLLKGHPDLTETLPFDRGGKGKGLFARLLGFRHFLGELRRREFDLVLDLQGLFRSGVMCAATRATRRVGLHSSREGASWFYTDILDGPGRKSGHAVDRYWSAVSAFGAGSQRAVFRFPAFEREHAWARETLAACPRPWLMTAVGSRWETKRWWPAHFNELLKRAQANFGGTIVFVGGSEDLADSVEAARSVPGPTLMMPGGTTLPQLAALLSQADVMIANDTGPLHLAVALGRPVVAPYTCTRAVLTGPFGQLHRAVETTVPCAGSLLKRCPKMICMDELTPGRLWPVLREVLLRWECNSRSA